MNRTALSRLEKLELSAGAAQYDLACACGGPTSRTLGNDGKWIYPVALPDGRTFPVLKVLQSLGCERNCLYCRERAGGQGPRIGFHSDELADTFMETVQSGLVRGLFLSSAIRGTPIATMDRMLGTLERIRFRRRFGGFIHTKIIPGAEDSQILRAMELSDRVSVNLEAPTPESLSVIAPGKNFHTQLGAAMRLIANHVGRRDLRCKSHTTQYVVGAGNENDREILHSLWSGYRELRLGRGYFSAFQPILGTPLENASPTPAVREHRLYQTDFLFRQYGFTLSDIIFNDGENLSLDEDPKTLWAKSRPDFFPLEINTADKSDLLRVPGIGPKAASRIVAARRESTIFNIDVLKTATARWRIAAPYLLFNGRRRAQPNRQLSLPW